ALPDERWDHVDVKTTNLIPNILAQTKAEKKFAYTAMLFRDGVCTEGQHLMYLLSKMVSCIRIQQIIIS
ncbi:Aminotransferase class IV, partial [human gut metagenome]